LLVAVGGRELQAESPAEYALSHKIFFNETLFQLLMRHRNDRMLQIIHEVIKTELCGRAYGDNSQEMGDCILRIYCRRHKGSQTYVHSQASRNRISLVVQDDQFENYLKQQISYTGSGVFGRKTLDDNVCFIVCNSRDNNCEGLVLR